MRGKFFQNSKSVVIESMAKRFMDEIAWCDFKDAEEVYSEPAENFIPELEKLIDFLFSINVLDHCFDFEKIILNVKKYLKDDGLAFLSFDSHYHVSLGHPLILTEKECKDIFNNNGLKVKKFSRKFPDSFTTVYPKNGINNQSDCLNFCLTPRK